jgi:proton-translocating NADH-quinone oxidoreductase chain L
MIWKFEILPLLPLFIAIFLGFFQVNKTFKEVPVIQFCIFIFSSVIFLSYDCLQTLWLFDYPYINVKLGTFWINITNFSIEWGFFYDYLTFVMLFVVSLISLMVQIYSLGYMEHDPSKRRFFAYLQLFTFFMLFLVTADNIIQMFVGWEGVGICSYLLINFWYTRIQANKAAIKALLVNKVGDCAMLFAIVTIIYNFGTVNYLELFFLIQLKEPNLIELFGYNFATIDCICFFLTIGAMAKSAQIGLHTWLPDAMEGPTPVSALIHAATMVTAGIFMIIRCAPLFDLAPDVKVFITILGATTAFFAATVALVQYDVKKIIAYSTCSQLGYMMFACGLSQYASGLYHLTTHAFFKALLFLSAGSIIHALSDDQDFRKMGGLASLLPFTYVVMLIGSVTLAGFPFFSGFYSKDLILEQAYGAFTAPGYYAFWLGTLTAFLTAFYSIRLLYFVFFTEARIQKYSYSKIHEPAFYMLLPLGFLLIMSIFSGYCLQDFFFNLGSNYMIGDCDFEFIPKYIKLIPTFFSLFGMWLCTYLYPRMPLFLKTCFKWEYFEYFYHFFGKKWYFDTIYNRYIVYPLWTFGYEVSYKLIDKGWLEFLGPTGVSRGVTYVSTKFSKFQSGLLYDYLYSILLGVLLLLVFTLKLFNYWGF